MQQAVRGFQPVIVSMSHIVVSTAAPVAAEIIKAFNPPLRNKPGMPVMVSVLDEGTRNSQYAGKWRIDDLQQFLGATESMYVNAHGFPAGYHHPMEQG